MVVALHVRFVRHDQSAPRKPVLILVPIITAPRLGPVPQPHHNGYVVLPLLRMVIPRGVYSTVRAASHHSAAAYGPSASFAGDMGRHGPSAVCEYLVRKRIASLPSLHCFSGKNHSACLTRPLVSLGKDIQNA